MIKDAKGFSEAHWKEMANLGWLGLIYDEKYGGSGGGFFDLFILFEEIGKTQLPSPFLCSAVFAGLLLKEAGGDPALAGLVRRLDDDLLGARGPGLLEHAPQELLARHAVDPDSVAHGERTLRPTRR